MLAHSYYIIVQKNKSSKKRRMLQLRWNNYYFVQNLYFDDKMKIFEQFKFGASKLSFSQWQVQWQE
jgi:hypothetical protein